MESFSIECTTCSKRLKVRDESLIGQILACPNCNAMVLVEQPQPQVTVGSGREVDSQAITSESLGTELEGNELAPQPLVNAFSGDAEQSDSDLNERPPTDWQSAESGAVRQYALIGVVAIIALVSSAALFGLFVQSTISDSTDTSNETDVQQQPDPMEPEPEGDPENLPEDPSNPSPDPPPAEPDPQTVPPDSDDTENNSSETPENPEEQEAAPEQNDPPSEPPRELLPDQDINRIFQAPDEKQPEPEPGMLELPKELQPFSNIFDHGIEKPDRPVIAESAIRFEPPPAIEHRFRAPASRIDVGKQLGQKLGFDIQNKGLLDAINVFSETLAVPLTVDLESLDSAGIDASASVSARLLNLKAEDAIQKMLASAGCQMLETGSGHIAITATDERITKFCTPALATDDLALDANLVALVTRLASDTEAPLALNFDAVNQSLVFPDDLTGKSRWRIAIALESIRLARDLPRRLPEAHTQRWLNQSVAALPTPQANDIVFEGDVAQPITHWLAQLATPQSARVLIDWPNAWSHGLTPTKKIIPWPRLDSIASAQQELLGEHGLQIIDLGSGVWIVTTRRAQALSVQTIAFAAPVQNADSLVMRIASAAGYPDIETFPGGVDPQSRRLICRLPHFLLMQLASLIDSK